MNWYLGIGVILLILCAIILSIIFTSQSHSKNNVLADTHTDKILPPDMIHNNNNNNNNKTQTFPQRNREKASSGIKIQYKVNHRDDSNVYVCVIDIGVLHNLSEINMVCRSLTNVRFNDDIAYELGSMQAGETTTRTVHATLHKGSYGEFAVSVKGLHANGQTMQIHYQISLGTRPARNTALEGKIDLQHNEVVMPAQ